MERVFKRDLMKGFPFLEAFLIAFLRFRNLSTYDWAEYNGNVPHLKDFTACHWEKLDFFNKKGHYIWNYCTILNATATMECIQMWYNRDLESAGRTIVVGISFGIGTDNGDTEGDLVASGDRAG